MADYSRANERFVFGGITCFPPDILPPGKFPYVLNVRSYAEGELRPRDGMIITQTVADPVHSLARLNDPTNFNGGVPAVRIIGAGANLYRGTPANAAPGVLEGGFSGNPLSILSAQPPQSPRPWAYVADVNKFRKFTTDGNALQVGIAQPSILSTAPSVQINETLRSSHDIITSTAWAAAGTVATAGATFNRINTTISQILYDSGNTGYCSIVPADPVNITVGTLVTVGNPLGAFDNAIITDVTIAVAATTVESIVYDVGASGLCTIQPAGSLGTGQLEAPPIDAYRRRAFKEQGVPYAVPRGQAGGIPPEPDINAPVRRIRQVDFPVNSIIQLGAEVIRILSVAVGEDGVQSFRCATAGTIAAGDAIVGLSAFRIYLPSTWVAGSGILRTGIQNTLTYAAPVTADVKASMTGGVMGVWAENLAQFSTGKAVLPDDELHVAVRVDRLTEVVSVRVYIDVNNGTHDFLQNYFFHEWRASDIISAIQSTNAITVTPLVDARKTVVANRQLDAIPLPSWGPARTVAERINQALDIVNGQDGTTQHHRGGTRKQPAGDAAVSTQLGLGNSQWIDLRVKIGTLTRVGTDPTRTLANAAAFEILLSCQGPTEGATPLPLNVQYSDLQIYGGGNPDTGDVGDPYVYSYRYRSSATGGISNPSPASRGGVIPRRQNVTLNAIASTDPQADKIDWFKMGGTLAEFTYVGTGPNSAAAFVDDRDDSAIDGGEVISYDKFQPWPLQDLPRTGTCKVAGTAVQWVSGDAFNLAWAPGSIIVVNGRATTLYASPSSATLLHVRDNIGSGNPVDFYLPGPTLMAQPLGRFWGPYQGFHFAVGDAINPGTIYYTTGNDPETTTDTKALVITAGSEVLQHGGVYNTFPFVASTEQLYALGLDPSNPDAPLKSVQTPCGRGFWTPWAFAIAPEGIYFLAADGIALSAGGAPAEIITSPDLRDIFPKDGVHGKATNGIPAPDMTQTTRLRLSYITGWLYFDYVDINGDSWSLVYDTYGKWFYLDTSDLARLTCRLEEPGAGIYDQIIGATDGAFVGGTVFQYDQDTLTDAGTGIPWEVATRYQDGGVARAVKQWGDIAFALDPNGSVDGIDVTPITNDGTVSQVNVNVGLGLTGRRIVPIRLDDGSESVLGYNLGLNISGTVEPTDTGRPSLFWWEPTYIVKADDIKRRVTDWEDLGYVGAKFVQGIVIRANTYGVDKVIQIQRDGGVTAITLTINHAGEQQIAYPLAIAGWTPFVTELVRIVGADDHPWQLLGYKFVYEPAPELATQWETQFTALDYAGYGSVRDMVFAYEATDPMTLLFFYDDRTQTYVLPATGGTYLRYYFPFCPNKERAVKFRWTTPTPARVYKKDVSMRTQAWGVPGGYHIHQPFGGPSFASGAEI